MEKLNKWLVEEISKIETNLNGAKTANNNNAVQNLNGFLKALKQVKEKIEEIENEEK